MNHQNELLRLYEENSKHSNYQLLPPALSGILSPKDIKVKSRFEAERFAFIKAHLNFSNKTVIDIGGNSGYFSFEAVAEGATSVTLREGNQAHARFVELGAAATGLQEKLHVEAGYFTFDDDNYKKYDVAILLNVLHHVGDDYGQGVDDINEAKKLILNQLNSLAGWTKEVIFQMGFCWQGNRSKLLFRDGTKEEMIDFVVMGVKGKWEVSSIGIAEDHNGVITYAPPTKENLQRNDEMGEFLNRPLFILKVKDEN